MIITIEVIPRRNAALRSALDERVAKIAAHAHVRDAQWPTNAMVLVRAPFLVLGAHEIGQHLVPGPTGITELAPMIVVLGLTPNVEQSVDSARTAKHFTPWPVDAAIIESRVGFSLVAPIEPRIVHGLEVTDWHVNPWIPVSPARFDEQHRHIGIGGKTVGEYATRRAGANNDVVIFFLSVGHRVSQAD
jgi:hypothetical protein